jgi:Short repeat of unknown function (DUF308)
MQQLIGHYRTMFLFRGIAALLFGVLTLVWPKLSLTALVLLFGVFAIISGITAVAASLHSTREQGWGNRPGLAGHHGTCLPLPAGGLGHPDWYPGTRRATCLSHERWARFLDGIDWIDLDRLRYCYCRPTCLRTSGCRLVDWCLCNRHWHYVCCRVLPGTLPANQYGLKSFRLHTVIHIMVCLLDGLWATLPF